jgi:hypothetical protein
VHRSDFADSSNPPHIRVNYAGSIKRIARKRCLLAKGTGPLPGPPQG